MLIRSVLISLAMAMLSLLSGCSKTTYFKHELKVVVDGRHYEFVHYFKCGSSTSISEADLHVHTGLRASGDDEVVEDVGGGKLLRYLIEGNCYAGPIQTHTAFFGTLIDTRQPVRIFTMINELSAPGVVVESQNVTAVAKGQFDIGASKEEVLRLQEVCRLPKYYSTVIAYVTPQDAWAGSPKASDYFARLTHVTAARVGEAQLASGRPDREVYFPDHGERRYSKSTAQGGIDYGRPVQFDLVDGTFRPLPRDTNLIQLPAYAAETRSDGAVDVNYKGTVIAVAMLREIYDPETKEVLLLEHGLSKALSPLACAE